MTMNEQVRVRPRDRHVAAEFEELGDICFGRERRASGRRDRIVKAQRLAAMRREILERRGVGPGGVEDRQHMRDPGLAMLAEFRDAADGYTHAGFTPRA